jgi:hypothetical protein
MVETASSRRERSRRNQKRYRDRKADKVASLEEQVSRLQALLQVQTCQNGGTSYEERTGIPPVTPYMFPVNDAERLKRAVRVQISRIAQLIDSDNIEALYGSEETEWEILYDQPGGLLSTVGGRLSPGLTYGIIGGIDPDRSMTLSIPPPDIVPFLQHTPDTFAKVLFWASLEKAFSTGLEIQRRLNDPSEIRRRILSHGLVVSFLIDGVETILQRIEFRLQFYRGDGVNRDHPGRNMEAAIRLRQKIHRQMEQQGVSSEDFLNARQAEVVLLDQFGHSGLAGITAAVTGYTKSIECFEIDRAFKSLVNGAVCLGDGPRWRRRTVIEAFSGVQTSLDGTLGGVGCLGSV